MMEKMETYKICRASDEIIDRIVERWTPSWHGQCAKGGMSNDDNVTIKWQWNIMMILDVDDNLKWNLSIVGNVIVIDEG